MNFIGSDPYKAGYAAGDYFAKHNFKDAVCLNTLPGAANIEAFCKGMTEGVTAGGGKGSVLPLPATSFGSATAVRRLSKATCCRTEMSRCLRDRQRRHELGNQRGHPGR